MKWYDGLFYYFDKIAERQTEIKNNPCNFTQEEKLVIFYYLHINLNMFYDLPVDSEERKNALAISGLLIKILLDYGIYKEWREYERMKGDTQ